MNASNPHLPLCEMMTVKHGIMFDSSTYFISLLLCLIEILNIKCSGSNQYLVNIQ